MALPELVEKRGPGLLRAPAELVAGVARAAIPWPSSAMPSPRPSRPSAAHRRNHPSRSENSCRARSPRRRERRGFPGIRARSVTRRQPPGYSSFLRIPSGAPSCLRGSDTTRAGSAGRSRDARGHLRPRPGAGVRPRGELGLVAGRDVGRRRALAGHVGRRGAPARLAGRRGGRRPQPLGARAGLALAAARGALARRGRATFVPARSVQIWMNGEFGAGDPWPDPIVAHGTPEQQARCFPIRPPNARRCASGSPSPTPAWTLGRSARARCATATPTSSARASGGPQPRSARKDPLLARNPGPVDGKSGGTTARRSSDSPAAAAHLLVDGA